MLRTALMLVVLMLAGTAHAEMPDLAGAKLEVEGVCEGKYAKFPCRVYDKNGVQYVVFRDEEELEVLVIFRVRDGAQRPYSPDTDLELLWSKDQDEVLQARNNQ